MTDQHVDVSGQTVFVSRYPRLPVGGQVPRNKKFSLRPLCLRGENLILDKHAC